METKGADQLWERYVEKTKGCNIPPNSIRWYVKRVEDYLRVHSDLKLHQHSPGDVDNYLHALGRNSRLQDWQFKQVVDALRIFFVDLLDIQWAAAFPWTFWVESSKRLPDSHATVARDYLPVGSKDKIKVDSHMVVAEDNGLVAKASALFPEHFEKIITRVRTKQYSIRTEQAYVHWLARYVAYHDMKDPANLDGHSVNAYLEYLVVKRNVSASTQSQALCALVFFYKQVLEIDLGDFGNFSHSKKPRRLPVVLSPSEVANLFSKIEHPVNQLMANLLYGCGLRLLECIRLRVFDIDFDYQQIIIRNAKGLFIRNSQ